MSRLRIFSESDPAHPMLTTSTHEFIAEQLGKIGVRFEQWQATADLEPGASHEAVLAAYQSHIDEIVQEKGLPHRGRGQHRARPP